MNHNTNNSNGEIPEAVLALVPWYAIDRLSVDDQAFFEQALLSYPALKQLVEQEKQMIATVSSNHEVLSKSAIAPVEERLKSVLSMIDIADAQTQSSNDSNKQDSIWYKLKHSFDSLISNINATPQYARVASVGVLVLSVAVLTAFVAPLFTHQSDFVPASADPQVNDGSTKTSNSLNTTLLVGFNGSSVQLGENAVLKDKLLKIETVPDKEGIFQISFKKSLDKAEVTKIIEALQKQDDLIWFAGEEF